MLSGFLSHQALGIVSANCEVLTKTHFPSCSPFSSCSSGLSSLRHVWFESGVRLSWPEFFLSVGHPCLLLQPLP